jgi:hypothetical protein
MRDVQQQVVETIVHWALNLEQPVGQTRVNRKLLLGDAATAQAVAAKLDTHSNDRCAYVVRCSTDSDAVRLRNQRPPGIGATTAIVYLVFWLPGEPGHERNFESLRDFPAVALEDVLGPSRGLVLAQEEAIAARCVAAAQAWPQKDQKRAEEHLLAAWKALRACLRERRGGRDRSIPFIGRLEDYLEYLAEAHVDEEVWQQMKPARRPAVVVERWGRALPRLSMFTLPALASVIGIQVDPLQTMPSAKKSGEAKWVDVFEEILAENKEIATDFAGLEENLAGHQTLRERLDELTVKVRLCQAEQDRPAARNALEHFCQSGDDAALGRVEWLFLQNPADRGSTSQGLKGLLIARKLRLPRENPLDKAARETTDLIQRLAGEDARESGVVSQYVEERKTRAARDRREAIAMAELLDAIASGSVPSSLAPAALGPIIDRVLASPDRSPGDFERLARSWEKLGPDADVPVAEASVLLGLVQLSLAHLKDQEAVGDRYRIVNDGESPGELVLSVAVEGERSSLKLRADDWSQQARTEIHRWLVEKVRPLYFDETIPAADEEEDSVEAITLAVDWVHGRGTTPLGAIQIALPNHPAELVTRSRNKALVSVKYDGEPVLGRLLGEMFETTEAEVSAEDPRDDTIRTAWQEYVRALGDDAGWGAIARIAPLPAPAEAWVSAWARAVSNVGVLAHISEELRLIEDRLVREDADVRALMKRRMELLKMQHDGPAVDVPTVRSLLRLCTGRTESGGRVRRVVLNPHHPLVLRLRFVGDNILATTLQQLWTVGWDRRTLDDLEGALDEWGLPEPIHCYGFWDGEPLVFDGWLQGDFALFSPLGSGREVDVQELGVRQIARELERYSSLFPAAADRLRLRLYGDPQGRWAWSLLSERLDSLSFAADVELLTDLPPRQPLAIDQHARTDELLSRAFEPGSDGELPRIRVMRRYANAIPTSEVHVSAVIGDLIEEFRSTITPMAVDGDAAAYHKFDARVLFQEPIPDLQDYSFLVGDAPDDLSRAVAKAVGFAAGHPNQVFRERYSFDPTKSRFPLERLQADAHWLVLASRQSLYRAVQQSGTATLLDFYSTTERGRPVHVCVSLDRRNAEQDIARLRLMLEALIGAEIGPLEAESVLASARTLAPGLAIRCIGSTGGVDLSGLVGLLLSAAATEADNVGGLLLALDQHRDLLTGRGQLSDLLRIRIAEKDVRIDVVEAKFSTSAISLQSSAVIEAQHQVRSTMERLAQFSLEHPLILRTRSRLARAIVHRIHLGASALDSLKHSKELLQAVLDPHVKVLIGEGGSGSIHAWSVEGTTQEIDTVLPSGESVHIHSRDTTLHQLRALSQQRTGT